MIVCLNTIMQRTFGDQWICRVVSHVLCENRNSAVTSSIKENADRLQHDCDAPGTESTLQASGL